jgi:hypothetical protein
MQTADSIATKLKPALQPLQEKIRELQCRIVPSTFNSLDDDLLALPLKEDWRWESFERFMRSCKPQTLMQQMPSFWQAEPFAHFAARTVQAPVAIVEPQNYPLDKALIRFASADSVIAEAGEAGALASYLTDANVALPPYWYLIYSVEAASFTRPGSLAGRHLVVAQEVDLAPTVPLLVQCGDIVKKGTGHFHLSELFTWSDDPKRPTISTKDNLLFVLKDFPLPFSLQDSGTCTCGKTLYDRVYT